MPHHEEQRPQQRSQASHRPHEQSSRNSQDHPHNDYEEPNAPHPAFDIHETEPIARFLPGPLATTEGRRAQKSGKYKRDPRGWIHFIPERSSRNITDTTAMSRAPRPRPPSSSYGVPVPVWLSPQRGTYFPLPYGQLLDSIPPPAATPILTEKWRSFRRRKALMPGMMRPWPATVTSGMSSEERLAFLLEEDGD